jgi:hypothetical protein
VGGKGREWWKKGSWSVEVSHDLIVWIGYVVYVGYDVDYSEIA